MYDPKKIQVLQYLQSVIQADVGFPADIIQQMKAFLYARPDLNADTKTLVQFGSFMKEEALERGSDALAVELPFNQNAILEVLFYFRILFCTNLHPPDSFHHTIYSAGEPQLPDRPGRDGNLQRRVEVAGEKKKMDLAIPGKPSFNFFTAK